MLFPLRKVDWLVLGSACIFKRSQSASLKSLFLFFRSCHLCHLRILIDFQAYSWVPLSSTFSIHTYFHNSHLLFQFTPFTPTFTIHTFHTYFFNSHLFSQFTPFTPTFTSFQIFFFQNSRNADSQELLSVKTSLLYIKNFKILKILFTSSAMYSKYLSIFLYTLAVS